MAAYYPRALMPEVEKWMERGYMVVVKGPRQAGKTTLLKMLQEKHGGTYVDLTDEMWAERLRKDPLFFATLEQPLFLDEVGMVKGAGRALKLLYDKKRPRMVVSGSGAFEVKENVLGYLVGRAISLTLYPLSFNEYVQWKCPEHYGWYREVKEALWAYIEGKRKTFPEVPELPCVRLHYEDFLAFGGYPRVVLAEEDKRMVLRNIVEHQLEKDIFQFFDIREKEKFREYLKYMAYHVGQLFNAHSTGLSYTTAWHYASILQAEYILRLLPPFYGNLSTELRKSRKVYFYDGGIARLLAEDRLSVGQENENFIFSQLIKKHPEEALRYWRTQGGAEVDFVLLEKGKPALPIEVKSGSRKSRSLLSFMAAYHLSKGVLVGDTTKVERKAGKEVVRLEPWWV